MVAPGVILTALHVAVGNSAVPQRRVVCEVRLLAEINAYRPAQAPFCKATLEWPAPGTSSDEAGDAALLVVADNDRTESMIDCAGLPVLKSRKGREVAGVGMPAFAKEIDPWGGGFREIKGHIGIRLETDALVGLTLDDQKHPSPAEWKGASGAVLLDAKGEVLVGILVEADHTGYAKLKSDLSRPIMIEMLSDFADTQGFQNVVKLDVISEERAAIDDVPGHIVDKAKTLLHLIDRAPQTKQVKRLLENSTTGKFRPVLLVSRMKERDCPELFARTVSAQFSTFFKDRRNCYGQPSELSWLPGAPPDRAIADLKDEIRKDLNVVDDTGLDASLAAGQKKRLFAVRIDSEAEAPTQEALKDMFLWWLARPECEGGPATLLVRIVDLMGDGGECPNAKMIYSLANSLFVGPPRLVESQDVLAPLGRCLMSELLSWSDNTLKPAIADHHRASIVRRVNTWIKEDAGTGNPFRLSVVRDALI